jgi:hypothetical protein
MTRSRKARLGYAAGLAVLAFVASVFLLPRQYACEQAVERSFVVDVDFATVRKILVRTDALKRIITMTGDGEFLKQDWTAAGGGLESLDWRDPKWKLELHGTLTLRTLDPYVGQHQIVLKQEVKIEPDRLDSEVDLSQGSERLLDYEMTTRFVRDEAGKTRVEQRLMQRILTDAPWFAHAIADARVRASAERALANQERAIRQVIDDNKNQRWLLLREWLRPSEAL